MLAGWIIVGVLTLALLGLAFLESRKSPEQHLAEWLEQSQEKETIEGSLQPSQENDA